MSCIVGTADRIGHAAKTRCAQVGARFEAVRTATRLTLQKLMCGFILKRLRNEILQDFGQGCEEWLQIGQLDGGRYAGDERRGQHVECSHRGFGEVEYGLLSGEAVNCELLLFCSVLSASVCSCQ